MQVLSSIGERILVLNSDRKALIKTIGDTQVDIADILLKSKKNEEKQELITKSIQMMYESLSSKLGDIATECLLTVFPDSNYTKFVVEFVQRRDSIEADLYLIDEQGVKYHPLDAVGGGVADLLSLMLRISYIVISKYDNFLVADEPLKFVDRERLELASEFIKQVCEDLNFKMVMVTHIPELIYIADTVYRVTKMRKVSVTENITDKVQATLNKN